MKTIHFLTAILATSILFTSCEKDELDLTPSREVVTTSISVNEINYLEVSSLFNVFVTFSETEENAYFETNENLVSIVEVDNRNGRLKVELENSHIIGEPVLNLYLTTNSLDKVKGEGAVTIQFENQMVNNQLEIELSGASSFSGNINTDYLTADIDGASTLNLSGFSKNFVVDAIGASDMTGFDFETNHFDTDLEGGCTVSLTVHQDLNVEADGASKIFYKGSGIVEHQNLKGASTITKLD